MELPVAFGYIGVAASAYILLQLTGVLWIYLRPSSLSLYLHKEKETWAFVSGASDGIGLAFAQELCSKGFNCFLHGRNPTKLRRAQEQLRNEFPNVKSKIIVWDASKITEDMSEIVDEIGDAHLSVLINNVGGQISLRPSPFIKLQDMTFQQVQDIINTNTSFTVQLTRLFMPKLRQSQPSLIINASSLTSFGTPWLSVYSGTKAFINGFSRSLGTESKAEGFDIEVMSSVIGSVSTPGNDVQQSTFVISPQRMARSALKRVGCGKYVVLGNGRHRLQGIGFDILPANVMSSLITRKVQNLHQEKVEAREETTEQSE
jgi:17beta-estradiol 17-dehydrogenase / very-long-chain 3-oxoacyl-CoA reductase